ncbi:similar to WSC domain-containing protein [Plenodomus lingam JN3]|nr:similar to WSC domain-containing protein [Plenodomus lingam JN3]CBX98181.1 similar to WSC domain-containing protein [Plenodomus lingam JN3]
MVSFRFASVLAAASLFLTVAAQDDMTAAPSSTVIKNPITTPTTTLPASAMTSIGCFATPTPLENHGPYEFQTPGNCQLVCISLNKNVMALSDGENCWCGDQIPAQEWQTDNSTCTTPCRGDKENSECGGAGAVWVVLTGQTLNKVPYFKPVVSSSSASSTRTTAEATSAAAAPTASAPPPPKEEKPNTIAIAVGVVVGVLGLAGLCFGVWFLLRRRRQKQAEEDYRRNAANVNAFVNGGKLHTSNSSMNDSRLDPSFVDRRQSNGSIADNEDYSRRILKVTNV